MFMSTEQNNEQLPPSYPCGAGLPEGRLIYILLAIFLGGFGIHNFYWGYVKRGVVELVLGLLSLLLIPGIILFVMIILDIIRVKQPQVPGAE